ncbi:MAG: hypothetical protein EXQ96_08710 [Alphaproteobacteria bacterium]|nr:hypothetical protein [Alphaproteobacteria bacterium]
MTDRKFYSGMAIAFAVTVLVGFTPTFYLKPFLGAPPLSLLVTVHCFVFTAWIALVVTQATLVAKGRVDLHRRLGVFGAVLALAVIVVGLMTAISAAARGVAPPGAPPSLSFLVIPFTAIVLFTILVGAALYLRGNSEAHKRLMILATIAILGAAIARLPLPVAPIPPVFFAIADLFILAGVAYDLITRGRVHPAYIWGGLLILASQPLQLFMAGTDAWLSFARWLTG